MSEQNGMNIGKPKTNEVFFKKKHTKTESFGKKINSINIFINCALFQNDLNRIKSKQNQINSNCNKNQMERKRTSIANVECAFVLL